MREFSAMDAMWATVLREVSHGDVLLSRAGATRELIGWSGRLLDPRAAWTRNPERKLSEAYGAAELLWYLSGSDDATMLKAYAPSYENYLDDGVHAFGAYGKRWREGDQLRNAVKLLREQPNTRQCVISCWRPEDVRAAASRATKDLPCTLTLQFLWRANFLDLIVTMRSNDAWKGMPYDVWCFTTLQRMVAACVDADLGWYQHQVGSLHLYEEHWERAYAAVGEASSVVSLPSLARPGFYCLAEMERMIGRAVSLEENFRKGDTTDETVIESLLGRDTILGEAVARCAAKWRRRS